MPRIQCKSQEQWLPYVLENLKTEGYCIVEDFLNPEYIDKTRDALYKVQEMIIKDVGKEKLERAGEIGVLRLMMRYDPFFISFLEFPEILAVVDSILSNTAILHVQNGFINPSYPPLDKIPSVFQNQMHTDFPRVLNGYMASINIFISVSESTLNNGGTLVVPNSHQKLIPPSKTYLEENKIPIECPAGSMIIFDSTLWHSAGTNHSGKDRFGINHQFIRSYMKQQIDYVRALGKEVVQVQKPRTQQLLGYYTQMVTSLEEYYRPEEERLYRRGQG